MLLLACRIGGSTRSPAESGTHQPLGHRTGLVLVTILLSIQLCTSVGLYLSRDRSTSTGDKRPLRAGDHSSQYPALHICGAIFEP
jgi:hypothetical protein